MIKVYPDFEALSRAAAALFAERACAAASASGRFAVLLAGGKTPARAYALLAIPPLRDAVPWAKVHIFWGDERHVPSDDLASNAGMARQVLLDHVPVPAEQIHPVPCRPTVEESAAEYEATLAAFFGAAAQRFDLAFLGLGEDGHTASLFPGSSALEEQERLVVGVNGTEERLPRVTLTAPLINLAACVAFIVSGRNKAAILREVLEEPAQRPLPARLIRPKEGRLLWLVDRDAAALL